MQYVGMIVRWDGHEGEIMFSDGNKCHFDTSHLKNCTELIIGTKAVYDIVDTRVTIFQSDENPEITTAPPQQKDLSKQQENDKKDIEVYKTALTQQGFKQLRDRIKGTQTILTFRKLEDGVPHEVIIEQDAEDFSVFYTVNGTEESLEI